MAAATVGGILANDSRPAEFIYDNLTIETNVIHVQAVGDFEELGAEYLSLLSTAAELTGDRLIAIQYLEQAVLKSPNDGALWARLGLARIATGHTEEGAADLLEAAKVDPEIEEDTQSKGARVAVILGYIQEQKYDRALSATIEFQEAFPDEPAGFVLEGIAHLGLAAEDDARKAFGKALDISPGHPDASLNLATLEERRGDIDGALALLEGVLAHNPGHYATLLRLTDVTARIGRTEDAKSWLKHALDAQPGDLRASVALARLHLRTGEPDKALALTVGMVDDYPQSSPLLDVVGQAQLSLQRHAEAMETFRRAIELAPNSADAHFRLGTAHGLLQHHAAAQQSFEAALLIDGGHQPSKVGLASLLLRNEDASRAAPLVTELGDSMPDDTAVRIMRPRLADLNGDSQTVTRLDDSLRDDVGSEQEAVGIAALRWQVGDEEGSVGMLREWLRDHPQDIRAHLVLSGYAISFGRLDWARNSLETVVKDNPDLLAARNDLAWVLMEQGQLDPALEHAQYALQLAPNEPAVLDTLGMIHLTRGEAVQALDLLRRAYDGLPENPDVIFHFAKALAENGDNAKARDLLADILAAHPSFSERDKAESFFRKLGS